MVMAAACRLNPISAIPSIQTKGKLGLKWTRTATLLVYEIAKVASNRFLTVFCLHLGPKYLYMRKFVTGATLVILVVLGILFWWRFYFPFGEKGVKAGELNFVVKKGYVFKTWEGRLIQAGYRSQVPGSVQSNEFEFSITDDAIAERLRLASGKSVELSYTEFLGAVPWRGNSKFIVDSIISIRDFEPKPSVSPY
jgi:hypothetical protein